MSVEYQTDRPASIGPGTQIASDQISGVEYQKVKLVYGDNGTAQDVYNGYGFPVRVNSPVTAFGEILTADMHPIIQAAPFITTFRRTSGTSRREPAQVELLMRSSMPPRGRDQGDTEPFSPSAP